MAGERRSSIVRRRLLTGAFSVALHAGLVAALFLWQPQPPSDEVEPAPIVVTLFEPPPPLIEPPPPEEPKPEEAPAPKSEAPPAPEKPPPPKRIKVRPAKAPAPPEVKPLLAKAGPAADGESEVSDAELASAATAGSGSGANGGGCNMTRRVQSALRKSQLIQASVAGANRGRAIRVWNGSWVRHGAEEGAGLAAVREAILWEVGFAPEACKTERVRGLVMISLNDSPGAARLVVGAGEWRWKDLLGPRRSNPLG
jgi:hypothetical protein